MLRSERIAGIVEELPPDDAADFVSELPEDERGRVLERMPEKDSAEVKALLQYHEETGGGLMTPELVAVREEMTAHEAAESLRQLDEPESIFFIHVVDAERKLVGSVPLGRLIAADPGSAVGGLVDPDVVAIRQDADQEEIARTFREYKLTVAPVVDDEGRLLGRITVDDVVEVIEEEATEDAYKLAGSDDEELFAAFGFCSGKDTAPVAADMPCRFAGCCGHYSLVRASTEGFLCADDLHTSDHGDGREHGAAEFDDYGERACDG